jgi:hypothetical protein
MLLELRLNSTENEASEKEPGTENDQENSNDHGDL